MVMVEQSQVWVGSEDSVIYIINVHSMSCHKQLTDHRASVTGLVVQDGAPRFGWSPGREGGLPGAGAARGPGGRVHLAAGDRLRGRAGAGREAGLEGGVRAFLSVSGHGCREVVSGGHLRGRTVVLAAGTQPSRLLLGFWCLPVGVPVSLRIRSLPC